MEANDFNKAMAELDKKPSTTTVILIVALMEPVKDLIKYLFGL